MSHGLPPSLVLTRLHEGDKPGTVIVERAQDCDPIAEHATKLRNQGTVGSKEMKLAASLPMVLVEKYCNTKGITFGDWLKDPAHVKAMLADPALSHFRIWEGRV